MNHFFQNIRHIIKTVLFDSDPLGIVFHTLNARAGKLKPPPKDWPDGTGCPEYDASQPVLFKKIITPVGTVIEKYRLEAPAMTDFNEPWTVHPHDGCAFVRDNEGRDIHFGDLDGSNRIVACVNALQGIENPQEFVNAAKDTLEGTSVHAAFYGDHPFILVPKRQISHVANSFDPYS